MKQGETEASTHTEKIYIRPHTFMHGEMCKLFYPNYYSILAEICNNLKNDLTPCPNNLPKSKLPQELSQLKNKVIILKYIMATLPIKAKKQK